MPYTLPLLGYQLGLINGKWLVILWWWSAVLNAGVRAYPQTGPMVTLTSTSTRTNTITVFYATPPSVTVRIPVRESFEITATVTALSAVAKARDVGARVDPQTLPTVTSTSTRTNTITVYDATPPAVTANLPDSSPIEITATVTALSAAAQAREADACDTLYGMQNCPLPYSSPAPTSGAARLRLLGFAYLHALLSGLAARQVNGAIDYRVPRCRAGVTV